METKKKYIYIIVLLVAVIAIWALFIRKGGDDVKSNVGIDATGDYTIEQVPLDGPLVPTAPEYKRKFVYPSYFNAEAKDITNKAIASAIAKIEKNNLDITAWIELGNQYNLVKDYKGAEACWLYAVALNSINFVPLYNLGTLYLSDMRDYALSEKYLKLAIIADPLQPTIYEMLYRLYRYGLKDDARAKAILKQGVGAVKDKSALQSILDHYNEQ